MHRIIPEGAKLRGIVARFFSTNTILHKEVNTRIACLVALRVFARVQVVALVMATALVNTLLVLWAMEGPFLGSESSIVVRVKTDKICPDFITRGFVHSQIIHTILNPFVLSHDPILIRVVSIERVPTSITITVVIVTIIVVAAIGIGKRKRLSVFHTILIRIVVIFRIARVLLWQLSHRAITSTGVSALTVV
jgi:hypothetical protein